MKKLVILLSLFSVAAFAIDPPKAKPTPAAEVAPVKSPAPEEKTARILAETRVKELETKVAELEAKLTQANNVCRVLEEQRNNIATSLMDAQARIRLAAPQN